MSAAEKARRMVQALTLAHAVCTDHVSARNLSPAQMDECAWAIRETIHEHAAALAEAVTA